MQAAINFPASAREFGSLQPLDDESRSRRFRASSDVISDLRTEVGR